MNAYAERAAAHCLLPIWSTFVDIIIRLRLQAILVHNVCFIQATAHQVCIISLQKIKTAEIKRKTKH